MSGDDTCRWCKRPLEVNERGRPREYCNPSHRKNAETVRRLEIILESEAGQIILARAIERVMAAQRA